VDIRGGSLDRGRRTTVKLSKTAIFSNFFLFFFRTSEALEIRPTLLYSIIFSLVAFPLTSKYLSLNDPEWAFYVKLCFVFVNSSLIICLFTNTDNAIISILGIDSIFGEDHVHMIHSLTCKSWKFFLQSY